MDDLRGCCAKQVDEQRSHQVSERESPECLQELLLNVAFLPVLESSVCYHYKGNPLPQTYVCLRARALVCVCE